MLSLVKSGTLTRRLLYTRLGISPSRHVRARGSLALGEEHEVAVENAWWSEWLRTHCSLSLAGTWSAATDRPALTALQPIDGEA